MRKLTDSWNRAISEYRYSKWNLCGPKEPVMPWIPPTTPVCLARALKNIGVTITLQAGENLSDAFEDKGEIAANKYAYEDQLVYINKGIVARTPSASRLTGNKIASLSISPAGRILGGGLDYFFCHPFSTRSYALTKSEVVICSKKLLNQILTSNPVLHQTLHQHFELCHLSNSITLEAISSLPVTERIKLYLLSWAVYWGVLLIDETETEWIRIPLPLLREDFARLISASRASVDKTFISWKNEGFVYNESPYMFFRSVMIKEMLPWLCVFDEYRGSYRNNLTFEDIMPMRSMASQDINSMESPMNEVSAHL